MEIQLSDLNLTYLLGWYGTCETQEEFDLTTIAEHIESVSMYATDNTTLQEFNPGQGVEDFTSLVPGHIYSFAFKQSDFQSVLSIPHLITTNHLSDSTLRVVEFCESDNVLPQTPTSSFILGEGPGDIGGIDGDNGFVTPTPYTPTPNTTNEPVIDSPYPTPTPLSATPTPFEQTPTPLSSGPNDGPTQDPVVTPSPIFGSGCCNQGENKHNLVSGVKKTTSYDNTQFVSQHNGVICWSGLSSDMIDGYEVLYYISFETDLDVVDLEILVPTSKTIPNQVVFQHENGDCFMGYLTDMTPTLNRFTLLNGDFGDDAGNNATPTPPVIIDPTPTPSVSPSPFYPFGTPTPPMIIDPTPTPYLPIDPIDPTPTPYNNDNTQDQSNFDASYHATMRQNFSEMLQGRSYEYVIEYYTGSKIGTYMIHVNSENQVDSVATSDGRDYPAHGFRTIAGIFQHLHDLFNQGVYISEVLYSNDYYVMKASGDLEEFRVLSLNFHEDSDNNQDDNTDVGGDYYGDSNDDSNGDYNYDDGGGQPEGGYSDSDYDNQVDDLPGVPSVDDVVDPTGDDLPTEMYDPVTGGMISVDDMADQSSDDLDYVDVVPNEPDPEEVVNDFEPPVDDPFLGDDSVENEDFGTEFTPPMDDPSLGELGDMDDPMMDLPDDSSNDYFEPQMDDPVEDQNDSLFNDLEMESNDVGQDFNQPQDFILNNSDMQLSELRVEEIDEDGDAPMFRNI